MGGERDTEPPRRRSSPTFQGVHWGVPQSFNDGAGGGASDGDRLPELISPRLGYSWLRSGPGLSPNQAPATSRRAGKAAPRASRAAAAPPHPPPRCWPPSPPGAEAEPLEDSSPSGDTDFT